MSDVVVAPSILSADFGHLADEIKQVEGDTTFLHIDVMDGHYVPNITFGIPVIQSIRKQTNLIFDVHLMITNPLDFIEVFAKSGADMITFHIETVDDPDEAIDKIHALGKRAGMSIHPDTPIEKILPYVAKCDLILIMSVRPGFGGQSFMEESLDRIAAVRKAADESGKDIIISVDGGICTKTAARVAKAGANYLVAGSAVFSNDDHAAAIKELLKCAMS
ncbi:MAG: ribulose-phosphate 3-epimerase [Clostridiales bacterium]|nr:ribulose-phosphate 3-epimerase [Clostridiales bacterium]